VVLRDDSKLSPRNPHYAHKINKPLPRAEKMRRHLHFAASATAVLQPSPQPVRALSRDTDVSPAKYDVL
jgi:hypothetical protein